MIEPILALRWSDVPTAVQARLLLFLRDFVAVSLAGCGALTTLLAADHAAADQPGDAATALYDGRRLAVTGAAWANGVLANALDFDDGHRLVKGHPGANVIPAALAAAEAADATVDELLGAVAVGYEVAIRAGVSLHERAREYHASGAWGAVGAAAAAARLLHLNASETAHALGLAEYHAPIAPIMRSVADPAMTKDACGWGAFVGTSSARLAERGFTSVASEFVADAATDLGERWAVMDVYAKKFPCCRWSHPAIAGALSLRDEHCLDADDIVRVEVRTFEAAAQIADGVPTTTEEAQYSLVWPVAVAFIRGRFDAEHVCEPALHDTAARELATRIDVVVEPSLDRAFPSRRLARVTVETRDGTAVASDLAEAPGEPDDPELAEIVEEKFRRFAKKVSVWPVNSAGKLGGRTRDELLSLLGGRATQAPNTPRHSGSKHARSR